MNRQDGNRQDGQGPFGDRDEIARHYGQKTLAALSELLRVSEVGSRLVSRGRDWYDDDPDDVPGLACESLIVKLGENVSRVSTEFRADHPQIPWRIIKDMRNRLTHYYEATDYDVVWSTLETDFPDINTRVSGLLGQQQSEG